MPEKTEMTKAERRKAYLRDRIEAGKCQDCGLPREKDKEGNFLSTGRCISCLKEKAKRARKKTGHKPHRKGSPGRRPIRL